MKGSWLPAMLSLNAGYTDTLGFVALAGLFTAHVTGNFVTLGAALAFGTSGVLAKLLALPCFVLVVAAARSAPRMALYGAELALLLLFTLLALVLFPAASGDSPAATVIGMCAVAAMAVQNVIQRLHLGAAPPTTIMTGNTTQVVIDLGDLLSGKAAPATRTRLGRMLVAVGCFALGCAAAALLFRLAGRYAFLPPPILALVALGLAARAGAPAAESGAPR